jgi:hypothetical protein|tara:strand:+ start:238 stop:1914 length:1677 start_codon:yes stop_codon:yes gene_type:complete
MAKWQKIVVSGSSAHLNHVTASGNISSSLAGTGSFGRVQATTITGDGSGITNLTAAAISSYTNSGNNRVVTSVDGSTVNSEANLEFDGTNLLIKSAGKLYLNDAGGEHLSSNGDILSIAGGNEIDLTATAIDMNGTVDISGDLTFVDGVGTTISGSYISSSNDIESQGSLIGAAISSSGNITGSDVFASSGIYGTLQTVAQTNITSVGALDGGSITSNFGTINNGGSAITTTGLISGGSLDIDDVVINATTIGHTDDSDLLTLADGVLTVAGETNTTTLIATSTISSSFISASNDIEAIGSVTAAEFHGGGTNITFPDGTAVVGDELVFVDADGGTKRETVADFVTLLAGDGIRNASNKFAFDASDIAGTGLTDNSENLDVSSAQTGIQTIYNTSLIIGRANNDTTIDFTADDNIVFDAGSSERLKVTTSGIEVTGNAVVSGDLTINGTTTTLSTTNLAVGDSFIFSATGSAGTNVDGGLVVQSGSVADSGSALYHDVDDERWAVAQGVAASATSVTPLQHVVTVSGSVATNPNSTSGSYGVGEMWITDAEEIWIRTS